jgi:hypothetical protein
MTTYILINTLILFGISLVITYLFYRQINDNKGTTNSFIETEDNLNHITQIGWKVKALLIVAFLLIAISFLSPFILTRHSINNDFDFSHTGEIGDTISGLMNPFIALAGVMVTGLAFYIQYKANLLQRELFIREQEENKKQLQQQIDNQNRQIKIQQFESQFYEMLKLHRENVTEMKIIGYDFEEEERKLGKKVEKVTEGRKVFVTMQKEFEAILAFFVKDARLNKDIYQKSYKLFFSGLDEFVKAYPEEKTNADLLKLIRKKHEHPELDKILNNNSRKEYLTNVKLHFNYRPFSGHSSRLGHYFRHLYLTVKSVANSDTIIEYQDRMKYLRILRAQLSNHEQIMLFYNWLGEYGKDWENEKHSFFTEYSMIHNLWYVNLFNDPYILDKVNYLKTKPVKYRKGEMFEID